MSDNYLPLAIERIRLVWPTDVIGIVLFGSHVAGTTFHSSDTDLLVVCSSTTVIRRSLYLKWDMECFDVAPEISPHFAKLPATPDGASNLWCEVASASRILWELNGDVAKFLASVRLAIENGRLRKGTCHGQPYWQQVAEPVRSGHA